MVGYSVFIKHMCLIDVHISLHNIGDVCKLHTLLHVQVYVANNITCFCCALALLTPAEPHTSICTHLSVCTHTTLPLLTPLCPLPCIICQGSMQLYTCTLYRLDKPRLFLDEGPLAQSI